MPSSFLDRYRDASPASNNPAEDDNAPISVSALNTRARELLEGEFKRLWIEGEISSLSQPRSGHAYFTLKDDKAQVRCALFRQHARRVSAPLREGQQVQLLAQVSLFEPRGDYQLIVEAVREAGKGALLAALEQLKERLSAEGIFANQRTLPYPPKHLAVITSPSGAAFQDVLSVVNTRWPWLDITLIPVQVQGAQAAEQMIHALQLANQKTRCDAILITRGGGSFEDLWCFNDEQLARALHASRLPVLSAVGHETDTTLSDFAADQRAPTPSAAAERLTPDRRDYRRQLAQLAHRLLNAQRGQLNRYGQQVDYLSARLRHPSERLTLYRSQLNSIDQRLQLAMQRRITNEHQWLERLHGRINRQSPIRQLSHQKDQLERLTLRLQKAGGTFLPKEKSALEQMEARLNAAETALLKQKETQIALLIQRLDIASPLATLKRGYAVLEDSEHHIIRRSEEVTEGQQLTARLGTGKLTVEVKEKEK